MVNLLWLARMAAAALAALLSSCAVDGHPPIAPVSEDRTEQVFALSSQADEAYRESRWIDAVRYYHKLTQMVPDDAYSWFRLGNTYAQQGAYEQAIRAYEMSLDRDARQPRPWFNLSTAYLLNAQLSMTRAWEQLRSEDPARALIEQRLAVLATLVHGRIEDTPLQLR